MRRLLGVLVLATALASASMPGAVAAGTTTTSSGQLCTVVGTPGADVLTGTAGPDVLCGLGGDDILDGLSGDDVLDGGKGDDRLYGGDGDDLLAGRAGDDVVLAGAGHDSLRGGPGDDRAIGGPGDDRIRAGSGSDQVNAGAGADVVKAGAGADRVVGGAGSDTISAGAGNDSISGNGGADVIRGGASEDRAYGGDGDDSVSGGDGDDLILGQDDDDSLDGGDGSDTVDGGNGNNRCVQDAADESIRCVYDQTPPRVVWAEVLQHTVDVTGADQAVTVRARVVDDGGVSRVEFGTPPGLMLRGDSSELASGTRRDGVWNISARVSRWSMPGAFGVSVYAVDRLDRIGSRPLDDPLTVVNRDPDRTLPEVSDIRLSTPSVDVRTQAVPVTVTARVTDDRSGLAASPHLSLRSPYGNPISWTAMTRVSGTILSGTWRGTVSVPRNSYSGSYNLFVTASDQAHSEFALGLAQLPVLGRAEDAVAPTVVAVRADRIAVDTRTADAVVSLYVRAKDDPAEGVETVSGIVWSENRTTPLGFSDLQTQPYQGTRTDGWWKLRVRLPQGTPPGRYGLVMVGASDTAHWPDYAPAGSPFLQSDPRTLLLPPEAVQTTNGAAWDGIITVVGSG